MSTHHIIAEPLGNLGKKSRIHQRMVVPLELTAMLVSGGLSMASCVRPGPDAEALEETTSALTGDVNGDHNLTVVDLQLLVNVLLGTETRPSVVAAGDLDGNGQTNVVDLQRLVNLLLACGTPESPCVAYTVGGTVAGLQSGTTLELANNGTDRLSVTGNGAFTFSQDLTEGTTYAVTIATQPTGQTCTVSLGSGVIARANVTNVAVACQALPTNGSGTLDPTFGGSGFVRHDAAAGGSTNDLGEVIALDASSRVVVGGFSMTSGGATHMAVWRYTASGALDTTFNGTGFSTHEGGASSSTGQTVAAGLGVDSNGRIVLSGYSIGADNLWGMTIWRYRTDGTLDPDFNATGFVRATSPQSGGVRCAIDASNRIIVAGFAWNGSNWDTAVWRYLESGTPDTSFNGTGLVTFDSPGLSSENIATGITLDSSGRILVTGYVNNSAAVADFALWRLLPTGVLDTTFGVDGVVTHDNAGGGGGGDIGRNVVVDGSGRIVAGGWSLGTAGNDDIAVWRFTSNGALDTTFNGTGFVAMNGPWGGADEGRSVKIDSSGRILLVGQAGDASGYPWMTVWRFTSAGVIDPSFNGTGFATYNAAIDTTPVNATGRELAFDATGRIYVSGASGPAVGATDRDMVVWRIRP